MTLLLCGEGPASSSTSSASANGASPESLAKGVALCAGGFLEGFTLRDSPDFDDWQSGEARGLERELASALRRLVERLVARGDYERPSRTPVAGSSSIPFRSPRTVFSSSCTPGAATARRRSSSTGSV